MMAPGLPEIGQMYHIVSPTIVALTLSAFLISFALGVRSFKIISINYPLKFDFIAAHYGTIIRDVWTYLGKQTLNLVTIFF